MSDQEEKALVWVNKAKEIAKSHPISPKEEVFIQHFLTTGSAGDAAEMAGYSRSYGYCLRRKPQINAAITEFLESDEFTMDRGERLRWWSSVTRGMVPGFDARARLKASELLAKAAGDFDDGLKVQINNLQQNNGPQIDLTKLSTEQVEALFAIYDAASDT